MDRQRAVAEELESNVLLLDARQRASRDVLVILALQLKAAPDAVGEAQRPRVVKVSPAFFGSNAIEEVEHGQGVAREEVRGRTH